MTAYSFFVFHLTRNCYFNTWNVYQSYIRNIFWIGQYNVLNICVDERLVLLNSSSYFYPNIRFSKCFVQINVNQQNGQANIFLKPLICHLTNFLYIW